MTPKTQNTGKAFQMSQIRLLKKTLTSINTELLHIQFILVSSRISQS